MPVGPVGPDSAIARKNNADKGKANSGTGVNIANLGDARIAAYAIAAGWSGDRAVTAVAIAFAESSGNARATNKNSNGSEDFGLWQVNSIHKPTEDEKFNPASNARKAYSIYQEAGSSFKPWVTFNTGAWTKHKDRAQKAVDAANKAGKTWIEETAGSAITPNTDSVTESLGLESPVAAAGRIAGKFLNSAVLVLVALVFIVLGIVILARGAATRMGKDFVKEFAGNQAKTTKVAPKPAKPTLSVEERARKAVEYSEARKKVIAEMDAAKAKAARDELVRKLGKR